jgi:hypothetical protein
LLHINLDEIDCVDVFVAVVRTDKSFGVNLLDKSRRTSLLAFSDLNLFEHKEFQDRQGL